jgi:hypothetical protein
MSDRDSDRKARSKVMSHGPSVLFYCKKARRRWEMKAWTIGGAVTAFPPGFLLILYAQYMAIED